MGSPDSAPAVIHPHPEDPFPLPGTGTLMREQMGKHPETEKPFLGLASRDNLQVSRTQATPRERGTLQNLPEDDHRPKVPRKVTSTEQGSMVGLKQEAWVVPTPLRWFDGAVQLFAGISGLETSHLIFFQCDRLKAHAHGTSRICLLISVSCHCYKDSQCLAVWGPRDASRGSLGTCHHCPATLG